MACYKYAAFLLSFLCCHNAPRETVNLFQSAVLRAISSSKLFCRRSLSLAYAMAYPFGFSVGDFLAVMALTWKVTQTLRESVGAEIHRSA
jgi:hypothetical protein